MIEKIYINIMVTVFANGSSRINFFQWYLMLLYLTLSIIKVSGAI